MSYSLSVVPNSHNTLIQTVLKGSYFKGWKSTQRIRKTREIEAEFSQLRMNFPNEDDQIRRVQLQIQFHGTRREDFKSIEAYVKRLKSIADSLAEIGDEISNSSKVLQLLAGLPNQYLPLKKTISSMRPLPDFEEASSMLYMQEDILLQDNEEKFKPDAGNAGPEQSSGLLTADTFFAVVDTVGEVVGVVGAVGVICAGVGTLGTVVGAVSTVNATRIIVGSAIAAVAGWKNRERK